MVKFGPQRGSRAGESVRCRETAGGAGGHWGSLAASLGHLIRKYLKTDQWTQSESTMQRESGKSVIYFMSALFSFDKFYSLRNSVIVPCFIRLS